MYNILVGKSHGGLFHIVTRLWTGGSWARAPARKTGPSPVKPPEPICAPPGLMLNNCNWCFFLPAVKRPEREVDHSPSSSAEVKKDAIYTSASPVRLHGMNSDSFTVISMGKLQVKRSL